MDLCDVGRRGERRSWPAGSAGGRAGQGELRDWQEQVRKKAAELQQTTEFVQEVFKLPSTEVVIQSESVRLRRLELGF